MVIKILRQFNNGKWHKYPTIYDRIEKTQMDWAKISKVYSTWKLTVDTDDGQVLEQEAALEFLKAAYVKHIENVKLAKQQKAEQAAQAFDKLVETNVPADKRELFMFLKDNLKVHWNAYADHHSDEECPIGVTLCGIHIC